MTTCRAYPANSPMPQTHETERRNPTCPQTCGSAKAMPRATRETLDNEWHRRPSMAPPPATRAMTQLRTADGAAPQSSTSTPVAHESSSSLPALSSRERASSAETMADATLKWLPETAIRWEAPQAANASSSPSTFRPVVEPQTRPAKTAPAAVSPPLGQSDSTRRDRMPRRAPMAPEGPSASLTRTRLTEPQTPWEKETLPHSSSPFGLNRPTPPTTDPRLSSTGALSQTEASA